ncbi:MAG: (Fe-S)-binding protein [Candidatus Thorarchaeota archaeon]
MLSEESQEDVRMCAACPKLCRHACPTFISWRSDSPTPHGRALLIHQHVTGTRSLDERGIEVLYQCLECSNCLTWCLPEIDIADIVEKVRVELVDEKRYPPVLDSMVDAVLTDHNPFGEPHSKRNDWLESKEDGKERVIYFTGCTAVYREREIAEATVDLLSHLDYDVIIADEEWCCASPLLRTGFRDEALEQAEHNAEILNAIDASVIVVTCPGCYKALSLDYAEQGLEINKPVQHISQFLSENMDEIDIEMTDTSLTYHDPCHLGRHMGIYEEPRQALTAVSSNGIHEMERNRDDSLCCGNGAGLRTLFPDYAGNIGQERVSEATRTGADVLVTACPFCKNMLARQAGGAIQVLDLPEVVLKAMNSSSDSRKPKRD